MKTTLVILISAIASISYAQDFKKHIKDYTSLVVSRGIDATLVKSDAEDLSFTTHGIDPEHVIVENQGDELRIKIATKALWQEMEDKHWWVKVEVPYKTIKSIEVLTGARVKTKEPLKSEVIDLASSMGAELEFELISKDIYLDVSMGGVAELSGSAETLKVTASMGSEVDLHLLTAKYVKAKSSMGSDLRVKATEEFDGHATMGGSIRVEGNPDRFYENSGMGGDISGGGDN